LGQGGGDFALTGPQDRRLKPAGQPRRHAERGEPVVEVRGRHVLEEDRSVVGTVWHGGTPSLLYCRTCRFSRRLRLCTRPCVLSRKRRKNSRPLGYSLACFSSL